MWATCDWGAVFARRQWWGGRPYTTLHYISRVAFNLDLVVSARATQQDIWLPLQACCEGMMGKANSKNLTGICSWRTDGADC